MKNIIKIAGVQIDCTLMDKHTNLNRMLASVTAAAAKNADLVVFPECALGGYMYTSMEEAIPHTETIPGPATDAIAAHCRKCNILVIFGLLEKDDSHYYNASVLVGPDGVIGSYRKVHLPYLGIDRFVRGGDRPFRVWDTTAGRLGLFICYDINFPESARVMSLQGADILILSTNWPTGRETVPEHVINTRALENTVNVVAVNRVGTERGATFIGRSRIVNAWGETVMEADREREEIIYGEVDLSMARQKHRVYQPGEFEVDHIGDRRPDLYGEICRSDNLIR